MQTTWLRYKEDRRSVALVGLVLIAHLFALSIDTSKLAWTTLMLLTPLLGFFCYLCHCINHNFIHVPIFTGKKANKIFSVVLGITQGLSPTSLVVTHNLKHHKHLVLETDWFHHSKAGKGFGVVRLFRYVAVSWMLVGKERKGDPTVKLNAVQARQEVLENLCILSFALLSLFINWKAFLLFIFPAWLIASFSITAINLLQHDGCGPDIKYGHSHNYTSDFGNWLFFNGGYHGIHHEKPSVHWSELALHHKIVEKEIPAHLNSSSLVMTLLKKYSFNFN